MFNYKLRFLIYSINFYNKLESNFYRLLHKRMEKNYEKIKIIKPDDFNSKLMDNIFEFEDFRDTSSIAKKFAKSDTKPSIFFSFVSIFQIVESIA